MCNTCSDRPIMHCDLFPGEHPSDGCYIECPACGRTGNRLEPDFVEDEEVAGWLKNVLRRVS